MTLSIDQLSAGYGKTTVIRDISAAFSPGTVTCILGPNGSGKSTLLKAAAGLCEIHTGSITLDSRPVEDPAVYRHRHISYLAQTHAAPDLTAERLILHGRFPHLGYPRKYETTDYEICDRVIRELGLTELRKKYAGQLSGGELQKVYLAMCLVTEAEILLLDEPNSFLDIRYQLDLFFQLKTLRNQGRTVIAVLHDINQAMQLADTVLLMDRGTILSAGTPDKIYESGLLDTLFHVTCRRIVTDGEIFYSVRR